jgi:hypothetical protein
VFGFFLGDCVGNVSWFRTKEERKTIWGTCESQWWILEIWIWGKIEILKFKF